MINIYKINMTGPSHVLKGKTCQDAYSIKRNKGGVVFAACADGLGSKAYADIGARAAVECIVRECFEDYEEDMHPDKVAKIMKKAFKNGFKQVKTIAAAMDNPVSEYDTTICMAIYDNGHLYYGQSGDSGMIALLEDGRIVKVTEQQRDETGGVFPLSAGPDEWEFGEAEEKVSSFMLMTDGIWDQICPPILKNEDIDVNVPLAYSFLGIDLKDGEIDIKTVEREATRYWQGYPSDLLDDDKTMIVVSNDEIPAARRDKDYYKCPDWDLLKENVRDSLYKNGSDDIEANDND